MHSTERDILQVRGMDPDIYRQMRIERASLDITFAELVARMWQAYEESKADQQAA